MPNPGQELSSINFEAMLGGPLNAVVNAQAQAAMTTVDFIKEVGFHPETPKEDALDAPRTKRPIYVTFKYPKEVAPYQPAIPAGTKDAEGKDIPQQAAQEAQFQTMELNVPILTMLPIPFLRIEETTIDFNAKITSVESSETTTDDSRTTSTDLKVGFWMAKVNMKVNTAYQSQTRSGTETKRTYSMAVHIRAVQDEMPPGTERLLGILENAIASQPTKDPPAKLNPRSPHYKSE